jgi:hypothetical protein
MKGRLGRVAVLATALAMVVTGSVTVSGAAATQPASPQEGAVVVQNLHDTLAAAADAGDVAQTKSTLDELAPLLDELENGQRYALKDSSRELADTAGEETTTARGQIEELFPDGAQQKDLPSVAEVLNVLLQRVLLSLSLLLNDLLGGLPLMSMSAQ